MLQTPPLKRRSFRALNLAHPHRISARMLKLSFLDLVPVTDSGTIAQSLANAADLARHAEALGYHRYWVAEHHRSEEHTRTPVPKGHLVCRLLLEKQYHHKHKTHK